MAETLKPDLCVIGAGSGGLSVAAIAASFGVPVVLVERDRMGGDCLNVGCVPSKALIAAGDRAQVFREAGAFGIGAVEPAVDFGAVQDHVHGVIRTIAPNDSVERFTALGVRVIQAEARFTGPGRVEAGGLVIEARRFVIATGSRPAVPSIRGLDRVGYLTNETVFDNRERPGHLVVVGAGPVGVELAQAHRRLGSAVTILARGRLLPREDPEMAAVVERALLADGVVIRSGVAVEQVRGQVGAVICHLGGGETLTGSHVLVATGRVPTTDGLGLEAAGIAADETGIIVDKGLRSTNRHVYAIGDCAGGEAAGYRFTHVANYHAGLVIRSALFRLPVAVDHSRVPRVTYTDPEIAAVGATEEEARSAHKGVRVLRWPVAENDRAQAERRIRGHIKAVVDARGRVLGCAITAPHAGDLLTPWTLALAKGLKVQDLAGLVFPYPTLSEVSKRAAVEYLKPSAQNPWLRRLIGAVRRFG